jgi:hypothetical protein
MVSGWPGCSVATVFGYVKGTIPPSLIAVDKSRGFQGTPLTLNGWLRCLGFDGDKFVAQSFGLSFEFCFQPFLPLGVSGGPQGLVIFDLIFDHGVKDHCDLMGGCHGGSLGAQLGFHSTQVVAQGREAAMEGISGHAE